MNRVGLIDTHAHIHDAEFEGEFEAILGRAVANGVGRVIAVGTTAGDSVEVVCLANRFANVFAAVGIHPNHAAEAAPDDWGRVEELADRPGVVAIGETGLDRFRDNTPFSVQQEWFGRHLSLASARRLPVIIHCRNSERDIIDQLTELGRPVAGVLHSFTGSQDDAQAFLDLGLYLSFAGMITFTNRNLDALRDVVRHVPADRLLLETDSPYLSPHPFRGQRNEPARVGVIAAKVAELRKVDMDEITDMTTRNARRLFALADPLIPGPSMGH